MPRKNENATGRTTKNRPTKSTARKPKKGRTPKVSYGGY